MSTLNVHANNVLGEFGFLPPEHLMSFEDVKRTFVRVRALEMQKLALSDTNKTLTSMELDLSGQARDNALASDIYPAFVEIHPSATQDANLKYKVEIVPLADLPRYEGGYAIAFYGTPMRFRLSFNAWSVGTVTVYYDAIEDIDTISGSSSIVFPPQFLLFLEKKTKLELIDAYKMKMVHLAPSETIERTKTIIAVLDSLAQTTLMEVAEWQRQFEKWKNKDLNEQPRLRRTFSEITRLNYDNVTGNHPLQWSED